MSVNLYHRVNGLDPKRFGEVDAADAAKRWTKVMRIWPEDIKPEESNQATYEVLLYGEALSGVLTSCGLYEGKE